MITRLIAAHTPIKILEFMEYANLSSYKGTKYFLHSISPEALEIVGERRALKVFKECARAIPAYKNFLKGNGVNPDEINTLEDFKNKVIETDKANYVSKYSFLEQCKGHILPKLGLIVESSGSSGKPTNWIEAFEESKILLKEVEFETEYLFKVSKNDYIVLSCWSLGPWTTDLKFCYFFEHAGIVKNIGPNIKNVEETIKMFGPKFKYIIGGYPPFLKKMIDSVDIEWKKYHIDIVTGGEGFLSKWRSYMLSKLKKGSTIFSAYGSSDLDTAVGVETPLCIFIRNFLEKNSRFAKKLFECDEMPMVFQYDPSMHYIENSKDKKEFSVTKLNSKIPNIMVKYNIHDRGGMFRYDELINLLKYNLKSFSEKFKKYEKNALQLPFLWIGGRSDSTISINGTNIYPQQVESALLESKELYGKLNTFQISKKYSSKKDSFFVVKIELNQGIKPSNELKKRFHEAIKKNMQRFSREYSQALREFPENFRPIVELYAYKTGPFVSETIKNKYIER